MQTEGNGRGQKDAEEEENKLVTNDLRAGNTKAGILIIEHPEA